MLAKRWRWTSAVSSSCHYDCTMMKKEIKHATEANRIVRSSTSFVFFWWASLPVCCKDIICQLQLQSGTWNTLGNLMCPINEARRKYISEEAALQLYDVHYMQYNALLHNCEIQCLKLINLQWYKLFEPFWQNEMYSQLVTIVLILAGMNRLLKHIWKMVLNKMRASISAIEYFEKKHCQQWKSIEKIPIVSKVTNQFGGTNTAKLFVKGNNSCKRKCLIFVKGNNSCCC